VWELLAEILLLSGFYTKTRGVILMDYIALIALLVLMFAIVIKDGSRKQ